MEQITNRDLQLLAATILSGIRELLHQPIDTKKKWLKSSDVREILGCSPGTLQHLRVSGILPFTKIGGTIYYSSSDVDQLLKDNKQNRF